MITLVEALNYRCLKYIRQPLLPFQVLIGPNASGKTTFLDVIAFLGRMVSDGLDAAVTERSSNFSDLLWNQEGGSFELAIEAAIPARLRERLPEKHLDTIRYQVQIGIHPSSDVIGVLEERVLLKMAGQFMRREPTLFPVEPDTPTTTLHGVRAGQRTTLSKNADGNTKYYLENRSETGVTWFPSIRLSPVKSALGELYEDEERLPASSWLKELLAASVQNIMLNSLMIKRASRPGQGTQFKSDGSNLPWVIEQFRVASPERFRHWILHLQSVLPDLEDVTTVERDDDKHRYLKLHYRGGLAVPSWMASDGTLRMLALTLPAYIPGFSGIHLIEEPENGIHPAAVQAVYDALSSVYDAQILLATHSPVVLGCVDPSRVLCFSKTPNGATDIISGADHPRLTDWQGSPSLDVLFASGVLS